jgi:uroporphyrinogen decarboxylase
VYDLIPDMLDVGVDVLNPVQVRASKMDPVRLKREFGSNLVFWGGIDEQYLLPRGTPEQIREEVKKMIDIMAPNGGFILGPTHNIQPDTPPENIVAMCEAAKEYGRY